MLTLLRTAPQNSRVEQFCARVRHGVSPQLMIVRPEPGWRPNDCFFCVRQKVLREGGRIQLGWSIWEWPSVYIEAERHAVYAPADGSPWRDISPPSAPEIGARLFLPDDAAAEYNFANEGMPVDNIREALAEDERIQDFFRLAEQQNSLLNSYSGLRETVPGSAVELRYIEDQLDQVEHEKRSIIWALAMTFTPKNAPCFCGSELKFKQCHGEMKKLGSRL